MFGPWPLARRRGRGDGMQRPKSPAGGGILIAIATLLGAFYGATQRQPSAGLVIGLGIGILLAAIVWLVDRRRG